MFLSKLNLKQKKAFLDACIKLVNADGVLAKGEVELIDEFCAEMNIKNRKEAEMNYDEAIVELNAVSSLIQRKQIFFELVRVAYADNVIKPREEQMLKFVIDSFKLPASDYTKVVSLVREYAKVSRDIKTYVSGK